MKRRTLLIVAVVAVVLATFALWWTNRTSGPAQDSVVNGVKQDDSGKQVLYWHDPMMPGHKFDKPGKSPFMNMQLVPQYAEDGQDDGVRISSTAMQNLGIRMGKAELSVLGTELSAVGRIAFDEYQVRSVQTRVAGFIERLYVRAVGEPVKAGQKIADIYAPELLGAQQELLALVRTKDIPDAETLRAAARQRLQLLGMSAGEIHSMERDASPRVRVGLYAPAAGVVQELGVREGAQVMPGQTILQIGGLARIWVIADLPERESVRVVAGQAAQVVVAALPKRKFAGKVAYVYPQLDSNSRTGQVRVEVNNPAGVLKPGMYAQVLFSTPPREVLTVPTEAVIATGTRTVVLVRENDGFKPVEVKTGGEAEGKTAILAGLTKGDEVVLSGQFLIDSEASLTGVMARLESDNQTAPSKVQARQGTVRAKGIVRGVNPASGTITLEHEPIAKLQWPAMTMEFKLRDANRAATLKPGQQVTFTLKVEPEAGKYVIESIEGAKP